MTNYRRAKIAGGTYFFTVNPAQRGKTTLTDRIDYLRAAVRAAKHAHPFHIDAWVVMPDHLHAVWTLPPGDADFSNRWRRIKMQFSMLIDSGKQISTSRERKGELGIWQRRFWEHLIHDETDFARHVDYVHINPVKHGFVKRVRDWPYSTFHRYVRQGIYDLEWGCEIDEDFAVGEFE